MDAVAEIDLVAPILALFALTAAVWLWMYWLRIRAFRRGELARRYVRAGEGPPPPEPVVVAGRAFSNLFETPVLFYVLCLLLIQLELAGRADVLLGWLYVALRALHALIFLTFNHPLYRFGAYLASCVVLAVMAARLAAAVL